MTMRILSSCLSAFLLLKAAEGGMVQFNPIESLFSGSLIHAGGASSSSRAANATRSQRDVRSPTPEEREAERASRRERMRERNERMKDAMKYIRPDTVERISPEELAILEEENPSLRKLGWNQWSDSDSSIQYADPGDDYDMWQQAYRMLGGFIDCDHQKDQGGGSHDNEDNNNNNNDGAQGCSRWMLWASYIDPNYQGNGYYEYFGDAPTGTLDCHHPNTEWQLLGVYRQEFYQYIEQISKHVWAVDEYEYIVALAGLAYMTDDDCFYVGTTSGGDSIYAGVAPQEYGGFQMALYTDGYCLSPNENTGYTFDDFGLYSDVNLGSGEGDDGGGGGYSWADEWWQDTQEYTLSQLNSVYDDFKYCTSCIDYPTYQDGYYIGDTGTDEDDLINQCWKFYSHDSYPCEADCIALAHSQGTILSVVLNGHMYGMPKDDFYNDSAQVATKKAAAEAASTESKFSRLLANVFVTFSFIVFVATFLAFAVARRSRYRESRSSKSRRLLDEDDAGRTPRSKRSSRSKSKGRDDESDGLFRTSSRKASRSKSRSKSSKQPRSRSRGGGAERDDYEPPRSSRRSRSRGTGDDF